jgi:hypothetical protein
MTAPTPFEPIDRAMFELVVKQELARMSITVPTLASVNRARRVILAAADAYRAWLPDADPPTPTQLVIAQHHRAVLSLASRSTDRRTIRHQERPSQ